MLCQNMPRRTWGWGGIILWVLLQENIAYAATPMPTPQWQETWRTKTYLLEACKCVHMCLYIHPSSHPSIHLPIQPSIILLSLLRTEDPIRRIYSSYSDSTASLLGGKLIFSKPLLSKGESHFRLINFDNRALAKISPREMLQSQEVTFPTHTFTHPHWYFFSPFWTEGGHSELGDGYKRTTSHPPPVPMGIFYTRPLSLSSPLSPGQQTRQRETKGLAS